MVVSSLSDFIFLNAAFFAMGYWVEHRLTLAPPKLGLLLAFYLPWLVVSVISGKFNLHSHRTYMTSVATLLKSGVITLYLIAFIIVYTGISGVPASFVAGTMALFLGLEMLGVLGWYRKAVKYQQTVLRQIRDVAVRTADLSATLIALDFVLLTAAFFAIAYLRFGQTALTVTSFKVLLLLYGLWFPLSLFTRKFIRKTYLNVYHAVTPCIKAGVFVALLLQAAVAAFDSVPADLVQVYGTLTLFVILEIGLYAAYYITVAAGRQPGDIESVEAVASYLKNDQVALPFPEVDDSEDFVLSAKTELQNQYLTANPTLFSFISEHVDLEKIDISRIVVFNTNNLNRLRELDRNSLRMFINLRQVNDVRWINQYFLEVHKMLRAGGTLVGTGETLEIHRRRFFARYPGLLGRVLYGLHFVYARVLPKLPYLKKLYFLISRGQQRKLSKAEILGRLYFCGYRVVAIEERDDHFYFIAQKVKTPSTNKNPSYGPIIKMRRIGLRGKPIYINKLRSMHPYAENLQEYVYEQNKLQANGKFQNDFRVTGWAKVLRKLWIDELPQLINYFQGDLNLVGVRALSQHYFQLYPEDLQRLRVQFKPGLIPPYYCDLPKTFEEIVESERRYLRQKMERPLLTDLKYLTLALYNIFFRGARSR